jgi:phosphate transport system substrate-binding protein
MGSHFHPAKVLCFIVLLFSVPLQAKLIDYQKQPSLRGQINSVGSDTLSTLMDEWVSEFTRLYPRVNIEVQASGSSTAVPALTEGTARFGPMSRPMRDSEIDAFKQAHGYPPVQLKVAIDAVAVYVNSRNPIDTLTIGEIDAIFSATRRCGLPQSIRKWQQLGVSEDWSQRTIQSLGRNSVSGTYAQFKDLALCQGDFHRQVNEMPGSASVVESVGRDISAIGYSGAGYETSSTKIIGVIGFDNQVTYPIYQDIVGDRYPLSRYLYLYINKAPNIPMQAAEREFLKYIFSSEGQAIVEKVGYIAVSPEVAESELSKISSASLGE